MLKMVEWLEHYLNQEKVTLLMVTPTIDISWMLFAKKSGKWMEIVFMYTKATTKISWKRRPHASKVKQQALTKAKNLFRKELEWMRKQPKGQDH
jgi:ATP-binding cassette subfamily F protein uup